MVRLDFSIFSLCSICDLTFISFTEGSSKNTMKVRSIVSYFVQNKDNPAAKEIVTINPGEILLSSDTLFLEQTKEKTNRDSLGSGQGASGKQKVLTSATTTTTTTQSSAAANSNVLKEMQNSINELKKQLDGAKIAKDQSDLKAQRLEGDIKSYADKMKATEDKNIRYLTSALLQDRDKSNHLLFCCRLAKSLEDVYRKMAQQEFRRTRDRLALDNVRLGKISTHRTVSLFHC